MGKYKPEEVHYKEMEQNNTTSLIDSFVENNTLEESKEHDIKTEAEKKLEDKILEKNAEEIVDEKIMVEKEVEIPKFCKIMNKVMISALTFIIISIFFMISKTTGKVIDVFGFYLSIFIIPINLFAIVEELFLLRGKSKEEKSAIMFYIILNISIGVFLFIYLVFCYFSISNSFNIQGLG